MTHNEFATKLGLSIESTPIDLRPNEKKARHGGFRYSFTLKYAGKGWVPVNSFTSEFWKGSGHVGVKVKNVSGEWVWKRLSFKELEKHEKLISYNWRIRPIPPMVDEVLYCLQSDCSCIESTPLWEDFADSLGYNVDSIKDKKIFKACTKNYLELRGFFGEHFVEFLATTEQ